MGRGRGWGLGVGLGFGFGLGSPLGAAAAERIASRRSATLGAWSAAALHAKPLRASAAKAYWRSGTLACRG